DRKKRGAADRSPLSAVDRFLRRSSGKFTRQSQTTGGLPRAIAIRRLTIKSARKTTNRICAMLDAVAAMPPKPNIAAIMAITRNVSAHPSMFTPVYVSLRHRRGFHGWQRWTEKESSIAGGLFRRRLHMGYATVWRCHLRYDARAQRHSFRWPPE